jgi:RimJ/RimL family protein N-acetyltransferase
MRRPVNGYSLAVARLNEFGQPVGDALTDWETRSIPATTRLDGRWAQVEVLSLADHASELWKAFESAEPSLWTYMSFGPFVDRDSFDSMLASLVDQAGLFTRVVTVGGRVLGLACFMRVEPEQGVLEIGSIAFSPALQRTAAATEAMYLMISHAFELGYRRCEWKCDDLNEPSKRAAERLGFHYEGTFRKATHYKGRSRDTAWYALIDEDWTRTRPSIEAWLAAKNFDDSGTQIRPLRLVRSDLS